MRPLLIHGRDESNSRANAFHGRGWRNFGHFYNALNRKIVSFRLSGAESIADPTA
jgi:hypothetical protein